MNTESQDVTEPLDTTQLLAQLKGIHLPEAPVAPSLWPVYVCISVCMIALVVFAIKHLKNKKTWHKTALGKLAKIQNQSDNDSLQQTAVLLKRIALTEGGRESVQHLTGDRWLRYLDNFFATDYFSSGNGRIFGAALYQPDVTADEGLFLELKNLVKQHKRRQS